MEKVYVIEFDDVADSQTLHHDVEVFRNYQDAKDRFDYIVHETKQLLLEEELEEADSVDFYKAWEDGKWVENHYGVYLYTVKIT